jgi:hypothetical protein
MQKLILLPCVMLLAAVSAAPSNAAPQAVSNQFASAEAQRASAAGGGDKANSPVPAEEKKICKDLPSSYTRMTEKVCLTKTQWRQVQEEAERQ